MKSEIEVPDGWGEIKLSDLSDYKKGKKPTESSEFSLEGFLPYLTTGYLREGNIIRYAKCDNNNIKVENDDILLLWDGSNAGEFFRGKLGILASTMVKLKLKKDFDKNFLFYQLKSKEPYLKKLTQGTGIPHVDKTVLGNLNIKKPPFSEQQKIADILSKVDGQIDFTSKIIDKTEELKKGLMQKLLTKGIGHTKFKKTELGEIPEEWEVVKIGHLVDDMYSGGTPSTKKETYWNGGIPWMTSVNINSDIEISKGQKNISIDGLENSSTKIVPKDNILFVTRVGLGKVAINKIDIAINQDITGLIVNKNKTDLKYLFWQLYLLSQKIQKKSQGTTIKGILKKDLFNAKIAISNMQEQIKIGNFLSKVDEQIQDNKKELKHLQELKKGLMQDLLTGKVRVTT